MTCRGGWKRSLKDSQEPEKEPCKFIFSIYNRKPLEIRHVSHFQKIFQAGVWNMHCRDTRNRERPEQLSNPGNKQWFELIRLTAMDTKWSDQICEVCWSKANVGPTADPTYVRGWEKGRNQVWCLDIQPEKWIDADIVY